MRPQSEAKKSNGCFEVRFADVHAITSGRRCCSTVPVTYFVCQRYLSASLGCNVVLLIATETGANSDTQSRSALVATNGIANGSSRCLQDDLAPRCPISLVLCEFQLFYIDRRVWFTCLDELDDVRGHLDLKSWQERFVQCEDMGRQCLHTQFTFIARQLTTLGLLRSSGWTFGSSSKTSRPARSTDRSATFLCSETHLYQTSVP